MVGPPGDAPGGPSSPSDGKDRFLDDPSGLCKLLRTMRIMEREGRWFAGESLTNQARAELEQANALGWYLEYLPGAGSAAERAQFGLTFPEPGPLPSDGRLLVEWKDIPKGKTREWINAHVRIESYPITAGVKRLLRYRAPGWQESEEFEKLSYWGYGLYIYRLLGAPIAADLARYWRRYRTVDDAFTELKTLGVMAKKLGAAVPHYRWWCEVVTLLGFPAEDRAASIHGALHDTFGSEVTHRVPLKASGSFDSRFRLSCRRVLEHLHNGRPVKTSFREYIEAPDKWGKSGAVRDTGELGVRLDGHKVSKTKWAAAAALTPDQLQRKADNAKRMTVDAITKREVSKALVRPILVPDLGSFLNISYLAHVLIPAFTGSGESPLTASTLGWVDSKAHIVKLLEQGWWAMPGDISGFDKQVSLKMQSVIVEVMTALNVDGITGQVLHDVKEVSERVQKLIFNTIMRVFGAGSFAVLGGLSSGISFTSWFGTVVSLIYYDMAKLALAERGLPTNVSSVAMGDDGNWMAKEHWEVLGMAEAIKSMDVEINPLKTRLGRDYTEFLREQIDRGGAQGWPARGIRAVIWKNPVSTEERSELGSQMNSWATLVGRGFSRESVFRHAVIDVAQAHRVSASVAAGWLLAPTAVGGGAFDGESRLTGLAPVTVVSPEDVELTGKMHGADAWADRLAMPSGVMRAWFSGVLSTPGRSKKATVYKTVQYDLRGDGKAVPAWPTTVRYTARLTDPPVAPYAEWVARWKPAEREAFWLSRLSSSQAWIVRKLRRAGRRWVIRWLEGKLIPAAPRAVGYSPDWVSVTARLWQQASLREVIRRSRAGAMEQIALSAARSCQLGCMRYLRRTGYQWKS